MTLQQSWLIPLAGNAFVQRGKSKNDDHEECQSEVVTESGLGNWCTDTSVCSIFFYVVKPGDLDIALRLRVPDRSKSRIKVTLIHEKEKQGYKVDIKGDDYKVIPVGVFRIKSPGYVQLDLQGVRKSGHYFADVSTVSIMCDNEIRYVTDDFYFGRRGPSVHMTYIPPPEKNMEYFYNEVTVPAGQDVLGAYYCAAGFKGGYFGMQANRVTERRILFSIWSAYNTDDPEEIPANYKVHLIRKGDEVHNGEFGDEGSGAQSYLRYNWKAGQTYKYLVRGVPFDDDSTVFTAWFWSPDEGKWRLIASFLKPKESVYMSSMYSFSENFLPNQGHIERRALFGNQWARDTNGIWHELTIAKFTGDATSKKNRLDFAGGVENGQFFLRNCGFFNDKVDTNQCFARCPIGTLPDVDIAALP